MKILIVKTSALGDIIQTFPVVEYLKRRQSVETIGWVVEEGAHLLIKAHPYVDIPIAIDTQTVRSGGFFRFLPECMRQRARMSENSFDVLFDLQGNIKSGLVSLCAKAPIKVGYGKNFVSELPNIIATNRRFDPPLGLPIREEYLSLVQQYFNDDTTFIPSGIEMRLNSYQQNALNQETARWPKSSPVWLIAMGSAWPNKMCNKESFRRVLKLIQDHFSPYFVFLAGTSYELNEVGDWAQEFPHKSHVLYRPELPVLQHCMGRAHVVLCVDSLALHLAATTKTPTFSFFGPSSPSKYMPRGQVHGFYQRDCPFNVLFEKRCPNLRNCVTGECLKGSTGDAMFRAVYEWYRRVHERFLTNPW
jgi:heptosyltransferase-1